MTGSTSGSPRQRSVSLVRDAALDPASYLAVVGIVLFVIALYANWSSNVTLQQMEIPVGTNTIQVASSDGMFMVGVFEEPSELRQRMGWYRGNSQKNLGGLLARNT